jgi:glycine cleavage system H protein
MRERFSTGRRTNVYPGDLHYSESHQWARVEDGVATVGVTHYAQEQLGDIVYVELPSPDEEAKRGEPLGSVESVKAVADVNSPVSGRVTEVNTDLDDEPEKINQDCYGAGWLAKIELSEPAEVRSLMNAKQYVQHVQQLAEQRGR